MYSASNKEISQTDIGWFAEDGKTKALAIEHGFTTAEAMMEIAMEWDNFTVKLQAEWTPEKLKEYIHKKRQKYVNDLRHSYLNCQNIIKDIEIENKEARVKGVSFKDRRVIIDKMKKTIEYRDSLKDKSEEIKRIQLPTYDVLELIDKDEMGLISGYGLEHLLDIKYPKDYLIALTKNQNATDELHSGNQATRKKH